MSKNNASNKVIKKEQDSKQSINATKMSLLPVVALGGSQTMINRENIDGKSQYQQQIYMGVNQVLVYKMKGVKPIYYVPAYLRMRIIRVNQINYVQSKAEIQTQIRIWLNLKEFPQIVQEQIINQAKIQINGANVIQFDQIREPSKMDQSHIKNTSKNAIGFLLTQTMELDIYGNPFLSPFQLIKLIANLEIKKIVLGNGNPQFEQKLKDADKQQKTESYTKKFKNAQVEFNFIDAHPFLQFSFGEVRQLGAFDIAESLVDMVFSNDTIKDDEDQDNVQNQDAEQEDQHLNIIGQALGLKQKLKKEKLQSGQITPDAYEHGQIVIPLYKYPSTTIINIFVPLYMIGIMNLGVFFEANDMSNRDASLATFLLGYVAFLPTIRETLPETPRLVFTQILVYLQIMVSIICFFFSLTVNKVETYTFVWNEEPAFLVCVSLTILNIVTVLGLFTVHKLCWQRQYNKLPKGSAKYMNSKSLNTDDNEQWWNKACEEQFEQAIKLGIVKPLKQKRKKKKKDKNESNGLLGALLKNNGDQDNVSEGKGAKVHPSAQ